MHAVINHLDIKPDTDWDELVDTFETLNERISDPDFFSCSLIRTDESQGIILVLFRTRSALDEVSKTVAAPWFAERIRPYLAGPANRSVGEIVSGALPYAG